MDRRRILGLSVLTLIICSLLVTKTFADEEENPEAAASQNPNPTVVTPKTPAGDDADSNHDGDENYVSGDSFNEAEDQFGPEVVVVGH